MDNSKKNVLFLCTGNSCRSQIAEAIVNAQIGDRWQAYSAGTEPTGEVHPNAQVVLEEIGIKHKGTSKDISGFSELTFDWVVTVCDEAAENCPVWLGSEKKVHIGFPDPAKAMGTEEEITAVFRQVRDDIQFQISSFLSREEIDEQA